MESRLPPSVTESWYTPVRETHTAKNERRNVHGKKNLDIRKILIIGSGPIVIGQAAEFDYAGTQACLALKEEGYEVVLCNSNPATIMTDTIIADKVTWSR